jgi:hypothetical protein
MTDQLTMTWEQKLDALNKLERCALRMRSIGDWIVDQSVEIKCGARMRSVEGRGATVQDAVNAHWDLLTKLKDGEFVVARAGSLSRSSARWIGIMWEPVIEQVLRRSA